LAVKTGLQSYCDTSYSKGGVNQMWILKNLKDMLEYIQSRSLSSCNSIKTFDFSTLYTTIPHSKLNDKLRELVQLCFIKKNGQRRYKYLVLGRDRFYFEKTPFWFYQKVLWNWYLQQARVFGGRVFQQTIGIPMGTNCAPLLADLFLYSYEADRGFSRKMKRS
jgi:hypothetical protein